MINDQHDTVLGRFYIERIETARRYCQEHFQFDICEDGEDVEWIRTKNPKIKFHEIWRTSCTLPSRVITVLIAIPSTFPDTLPKIYLSREAYEQCIPLPIPHLDNDRFLCTRDPEVIFFNDKIPGEAIVELLNIAKQEMVEGIEGKNRQDFSDEFLAYWDHQSVKSCITIFDPGNEIKSLDVYKLSHPLRNENYIISDNEFTVSSWASITGGTAEHVKTLQAAYFPIEESADLSPVDFEDHKDVFRAISKLSARTRTKLDHFFNKKADGYIVIAGFIHDGERCIFGWFQKRWKKDHFRGFRIGRVNLATLFSRSQKEPIEKLMIMRLDRNRLMNRGGGDERFNQGQTSMIIAGCGAIGSHLAMSLARCGLQKLLLIDPEILEIENVPRHLCGMSYAIKKMKKVDALCHLIKNQFPDIQCNRHYASILDLLSSNLEELNSYDVLIVAIGRQAIERRICFMLKEKQLNTPTVLIWIEPLGVGGHILCFAPGATGYEELFDGHGNYKYAIADHGQFFMKREAGCQSSFLPYSSLTAEEFSKIATRTILEWAINPVKNIAVTWIGDITHFREKGYKVSEAYRETEYGEIIPRHI